MIVVTEHFFVPQDQWSGFEEYCRRLAGIMAGRRGCHHSCFVRGRDGMASHRLCSIWESLELFIEWARSDAVVPGASSAPIMACLATRQAEVQILPPARPGPGRCPGPRPGPRALRVGSGHPALPAR